MRKKCGGFDPFGKIVDTNNNEAMSIGSCGLDLSNHVNAPHFKWPRSGHDIQRNRWYMDLVSIDLEFVTSS